MHEADILYVDVEFLCSLEETSAYLLADGLPGFEELISIV
jgi:hypothetical protein